MNEPFYPFLVQNHAYRFVFESVGKQTLQKLVFFTATSEPNLFQLSLADKLPDGSLDFLNVSNNGDFEKVMATIAQIILSFLSKTLMLSLLLQVVHPNELACIESFW